jgi:hypothetical protein
MALGVFGRTGGVSSPRLTKAIDAPQKNNNPVT